MKQFVVCLNQTRLSRLRNDASTRRLVFVKTSLPYPDVWASTTGFHKSTADSHRLSINTVTIVARPTSQFSQWRQRLEMRETCKHQKRNKKKTKKKEARWHRGGAGCLCIRTRSFCYESNACFLTWLYIDLVRTCYPLSRVDRLVFSNSANIVRP